MFLRFLGWAGISAAAGTFAISASASDTDEPLFVIQDGRRIPTVIVPPSARSAQAAPQVIVIDPQMGTKVIDPAGQSPAADRTDGGHSDALTAPSRSHGADRPLEGISPRKTAQLRRHVTASFRGYPVSYGHRAGTIDRFGRRATRGYGGDFAGGDYGGYAPYGYDVPFAADPYAYYSDLDDAYTAGRYDERYEQELARGREDMAARKERLLSSHDKALDLGLGHLKNGEYEKAVVALTLAGELDNGDPACRVHLAQARMAIGHYDEAGRDLRRALELQPKLLYFPLDLQAQYPDPGTFDEHVDQLADWVKTHSVSADTYFLLGVMNFQRNHLKEAYGAFRVVARSSTARDDLTDAFLKVTRPARK